MLIAARTIVGSSVTGADGHVGSVADLYFDDHSWSIRYLVVDTGVWLPGRKVLLVPSTVDRSDWNCRNVDVRQSMQQIKDSPPIAADMPVSRQLEIELSDYYQWSRYWSPGGEMPAVGVPRAGDAFEEFESEAAEAESSLATDLAENHDPDLRSVQEVKRYHIEAADGDIGHVEDFIVDDEASLIRYVVINTRNWLPGKSVLIAPRWIESINWTNHRVRVDLTRDTVKNCPSFDPSEPVNRTYEEHLYDYFGREKYWK